MALGIGFEIGVTFPDRPDASVEFLVFIGRILARTGLVAALVLTLLCFILGSLDFFIATISPKGYYSYTWTDLEIFLSEISS